MAEKKRHPTTVEGFNGTIEELARRVCRMRYDKVADFFREVASELDRQKLADRKRGRPQLANALFHTSSEASTLEERFRQIFDLCKPYMQDELEG